MSRIGKQPIVIPAGVEIKTEGQTIVVTGKKGVLSRVLPEPIDLKIENDRIEVSTRQAGKDGSMVWGLARSLIANMVTGVSTGFTRGLEIIGVGYKAAVVGSDLKLGLGYSHEILYPIPSGVAITVEKNTLLTVSGADCELIGKVCADIRRYRSPEPYKGKGVRYAGERVTQKVGKKKK